MERTLVEDLKGRLNSEVLVKGWVERIRELSSVTFLIIRDRTGRVQVAADPRLCADLKIST
ncbi:MAG: OB-fold nucleic acid binding domain-containing protein, partial [Limnochordia bacterium]